MVLKHVVLRAKLAACLTAFAALHSVTGAIPVRAQQNSVLAAAIKKVMDRPEFKRANFGVEFLDLSSNEVVYAFNAEKLFVPASTTKTLSEGALLATLGKDYRF